MESGDKVTDIYLILFLEGLKNEKIIS